MRIEKNAADLTRLDSLIAFSDEWEKRDPYFLEFDNPETDITELHKKWGIPEPGFPEDIQVKAN